MVPTLAAVDVGTNSLHLVVARTTDTDRFEVLTREKDMVRLGSSASGGSGDIRELSDDAVDRAVAALDRYRRIADSYGAPLRAVATSAVREAKNRKVFLRRAHEEAGVDIEVVSGVEEARLIHLGVLQALDVFDDRILLFDIGGGSTELLVGQRGEMLATTSLKLGAVRLTNRFFAGDSLHPAALDSCRRHVKEQLSTFERPVRELGFDRAIGCSGTIEQVLRMARGLDGEGALRTLNGAVLTRRQVASVLEAVYEARRSGTTEKLPDLDPKRADILLAGVVVLEGIVHALDVESLTISDYALREGVFLDTVARRQGGRVPHLRDVARRGVVDLMKACDEDAVHSEHVAGLALQLFDALQERLGLADEARALLEAGALLANVGLVVSHGQHHKHAYYVIRNSDRLVGLTDREIELVAQIARYHRKADPKAAHEEWAALAPDDQDLVRKAAALLRVAIGLDRAHAQHVRAVRVEVGEAALEVVAVPAADDTDVSLDLFAANERCGLLADVLGLPVGVVVAPS